MLNQKYHKMKYLLICLLAITISCGGGSAKEPSEPISDVKEAKSLEKSCLSEITDPGKWYSVSQVTALTNQSAADVKMTVSEKYSQVQFNWKSDRKYTMKVGKTEMEIPTNNTISITIKNLDVSIEKATRMHKGKTFTYAEYFDGYHTQATKEEQKIIDEQIDKKAERDKDFDAETVKKVLALAPTEGYSDIGDLGNDANKYVQLAPGLRETRLAVLHGNVVLLVNVDISDDDEADFIAARSIAEAVMALCD